MAGEDSFTVPQPLQRDIDIQRVLESISVGANCSLCGNGSNTGTHKAWMGTSKDVLYIALPVIMIWGLLTGLLNVIVLLRRIRVSNDAYMLGLVLASLCLLTCGVILKLPEYTGPHNFYQYSYGYVKSLNDWFWYTSLWILLVMTLERSITVTTHKGRSTCSPSQAFAIVSLIFVVCFVSALPQFWEYEIIETFDYGTNSTLVLTQLSQASETPEYAIMYFWYVVSITVFLPYPMLLVMVCVLAGSMTQSHYSHRRLNAKHNTPKVLNRKVMEEIHLSRLFIVLILLYYLFTGPLTFLQLIDRVAPHWTWDNSLYLGLHNIFEFVFYFYYSIQFLLYVTYSDSFRLQLLRTCCCCCVQEWSPVHRTWPRHDPGDHGDQEETTLSLQPNCSSHRTPAKV